MRKYLGIGLLVLLLVAVTVGAAMAKGRPGPPDCWCECIVDQMYKCCPDYEFGYIICEPGCRFLPQDCTEPAL
ncbi:MAG: hypothetical protein JSV52_08640 [Candidatus Zixiibacteriota bacterium]|nr:MAG: hypothetical protein JSV52_08640 [candidate division Zixibacteria bacterium]